MVRRLPHQMENYKNDRNLLMSQIGILELKYVTELKYCLHIFKRLINFMHVYTREFRFLLRSEEANQILWS